MDYMTRNHYGTVRIQVYDVPNVTFNRPICMHIILLEDNAKNNIESERRLNSIVNDMLKKEIIK